MEYTHLTLNEEIEALAGYYKPLKEEQLKYDGRKVLYIIGQLAVESACCGAGNYAYAVVPGYIRSWKSRKNQDGLSVSEVEPVPAKAAQEGIRKAVQEAEHVSQVEFW